ncbi:MAG: PrsW family glutamic-type intramembrane protease [Propionibacteriaceae bacterium]
MLPPPTMALPPRRPVSVLMVLMSVALGLGSLAVAVVLVLSGGPLPAAISTLAAAISVPLLILVTVWLDRYEPEPPRYLIAALGWGGIGATSLALGIEYAASAAVSDAVSTAVVAPLAEEFTKGLFLVVIMIWRRHEVDGILDGIVYAAFVAIGFAFVENILYYQQSFDEAGVGVLTATFVLRGVFGPFAHPLFTSATGIGLGVAISTRRPALRIIAPAVGFLCAALLHGAWNGSALVGGFSGYVTTYFVGMLPVLGVVIGIGIWARRREGTMLSSALQQCAAMGWLGVDEIRWVASLSNRASARRWIQTHFGKPAAKIARDYQQTLTEMAFLHNRVMRGVAPAAVADTMAAILYRAAVLRPQVHWPPAPYLPGMPPRLTPPGAPPAMLPPASYSPIPGPPGS